MLHICYTGCYDLGIDGGDVWHELGMRLVCPTTTSEEANFASAGGNGNTRAMVRRSASNGQ